MPASVDRDDVEQRIVEAAACLPSYGGLTGWAALRWAGARDVSGTDAAGERPITLAVMHGEIRSQRGIRVTSERLPPRDLTREGGLRVTTHVRSVCFEMRYAGSDRDAVVMLDTAMRDDVVSLGETAAYVATLNGWTGVGRCRAALAHADENSWSPQESVMRLIWVLDCELPRPLCNRPVFDRSGRHVGTPDLIDVDAGLVGEYEGAVHLDRVQRGRDLQKEAVYRRLGLEHVTMVAADLRDPGATIVPRILDARARALFEGETQRRWSVEPPPWWTPTTTVAHRRGLSDWQRTALLRYRAA